MTSLMAELGPSMTTVAAFVTMSAPAKRSTLCTFQIPAERLRAGVPVRERADQRRRARLHRDGPVVVEACVERDGPVAGAPRERSARRHVDVGARPGVEAPVVAGIRDVEAASARNLEVR